MRSDRKVIILDNIKSDCIEQAMFILKDSSPQNIDAVTEAEKIVENYTKRLRYKLYPYGAVKRRAFPAAFLGIAAGVGIFALIFFITGTV